MNINIFAISKFYRTNNRIRAGKVKVIGADGKFLGDAMDLSQALQMAQEQELDLVEIVAKTDPPVCKIMDFGKFKYDKERDSRISKIKQRKTGEIKGVRIGFKEGQHDLDFKSKSAIKFLEKGYKVKIELRVKGREKAHFDLAYERLNDFVKNISQTVEVTVDGRIQKSPRGLIIIIQSEKK
ncbi:translation initiation factor IF-3 [bacterium]|nr:MAG: translation initiation factor IF-3 [bacterium]